MISVAVGLSETTLVAVDASRGSGAPKSSSWVLSGCMLALSTKAPALSVEAELLSRGVQLALTMQSSALQSMSVVSECRLREKNKGHPLFEKMPGHA